MVTQGGAEEKKGRKSGKTRVDTTIMWLPILFNFKP
jgi:hypothetical protein